VAAVTAGLAVLCVAYGSNAPQRAALLTVARVSAPLSASVPAGAASAWTGTIKTTTSTPSNAPTCDPVTGVWKAALALTVDAQGVVQGTDKGAVNAGCAGVLTRHNPFAGPVVGQLTAHAFSLHLAWVAGVVPALIVPLTSSNAARAHLSGTIDGTAWTTTVTLTRTGASGVPPRNPCPTPTTGLNKNLKPSAAELQAIKHAELPGGELKAQYLKPYADPLGLCTIGWGHLLQKSGCTGDETAEIDGETVTLKNGITQAQAQSLFDTDVAAKVQLIDDTVKVPLTQNQFDALLDFVFNGNPVQYKGSSLLKDINCQNYDDVPAQFRRWVYGHTPDGQSVQLQGLVQRRELEADGWQSRSPATPTASSEVVRHRVVWVPLSSTALIRRAPVTPGLSASPSQVGSGGHVVVSGSSWSETPGCQSTVGFLAYVVGISPYPSVAVGTGSIAGGHFSVTWTAPQVQDRLQWTIRGVQKCGTTTVVAYTTVTIG
jgi:lysozyme